MTGLDETKDNHLDLIVSKQKKDTPNLEKFSLLYLTHNEDNLLYEKIINFV